MRRVLAILFLVSLLAACAGPADPNPPDGQPGTPGALNPTPGPDGEQAVISFAAWDYERQIYEPLAEKFNAENPGIKVVVVSLDDLVNVSQQPGKDDPLSTLRRVVSGADTAPAIFIAPEAYGSSLLLDLRPLMDADASFDRDDFFPGALERVTVKDGTWVLPRYFYLQLLAYNKDLLKQANIPEPQATWTWNDILAIAQQVARKNGSSVDTYGYLDQTAGFSALLPLLQAQDIDLLNTPAREVKLDRPEIADGFKRVRELIESGAMLSPGMSPKGEPPDVQQIIQNGRVAIWPDQQFFGPLIEGPRGQPQQPEYTFPVGKLPYPAGDLFSTGGNDGFLISGGTAYPNESWKWIEFLSRQVTDMPGYDPAASSYAAPGRIPARKSIAEQIGAFKNLDEATVNAYQQALAQPIKVLERTPEYLAIGTLQQALSQFIADTRGEPERLLAEAQRQLEEQLAQMELTPTPEPDTSPVFVATPEPQEAPPGGTTVTFTGFGYSPSDLRRIARSFREQNPEIFVKIRNTDTFTGPVDLPYLAQTSDCFVFGNGPRSDAEAQALLDLQPLIDADATFPLNDYPAALLEPYRRGSGLYGLPYTVNLRTLAYNLTAFEAAGVQAPRYQWLPNDFLAAAQALTTGSGDRKQYGYVPTGGAQDLFFFVGQFGARMTTGSGKDLRANFADPKVVEAIQWYLDLDKVHKVMPPITFPYRRDDPGVPDISYELISNGRAAMWFDQGVGYVKGPEGGPQFEVKVAPLPIGGGGLRSGDFYAQGLFISAQSEHTQACWEWLKFLSADLSQVQQFGGLPARTSVATSETYKQNAPPEVVALYEAYAEALNKPGEQGDSINDVYGGNMDLYWLFKAIDEAQTKGADLSRGLADAQEKTNAFMECLAKDGTAPECALQVDPAYNGFNVEQPPDIGIPRG